LYLDFVDWQQWIEFSWLDVLGTSTCVTDDWGFPVMSFILENNFRFYSSAIFYYLESFFEIEFVFLVETSACSRRNFDHISALIFWNSHLLRQACQRQWMIF
jgi:hypothetical protein